MVKTRPHSIGRLQLHALGCLVPALLLTGSPAYSQVNEAMCGPVWGTHHHGPFDYRRASEGTRRNVENFHFAPRVETLVGGQTNRAPGPDLNYTLRAFPNHHRALVSATRLAERDRTDQPEGMEWPVECYFERALRLARDDIVVRGLYAQWLGQRKRHAEAELQLAAALELAGDNPLSHLNIGLVYFELGQFQRAATQARRARDLGWPRTELIDRLRAGGHWTESTEATELTPAAQPGATPPAPGDAAGVPAAAR